MQFITCDTEVSVANWLLRALPETDFLRLLPHLEPVQLECGQIIYDAAVPIRGFYFLDSGIVSLTLRTEDNIEVDIVGYEGMIGTVAMPEGAPKISQAVVQVAGSGWWMPAGVLRQEFKRDRDFQLLVVRYLRSLRAQIAQTVLCNRVHTTEERLSRWLLLAHNLVNSDRIDLSLHFIAQLLGTSYTQASVAAGVLWKEGLIRFGEDYIQICNASGLEARACECHSMLKPQYERLVQYV